MIFSSNVVRSGLSLIFRTTAAKPVLVNVRYLHEVYHNPSLRIFFVPLDNNTKHAVLYYRVSGKIMDLRSINVPPKYKGQGIAKLLTDTAFTYAIVNNYKLFLTCTYTQSYYLANRNSVLEKIIIGPKKILDKLQMLHPDQFEELPEPGSNDNGKKQ